MLGAGLAHRRARRLRGGLALLLALLATGLPARPIAAGAPIDVCTFLPPGLPTVDPYDENEGCGAYDHAWPDILDAWSLSISWYGNSLNETPAGSVREAARNLGLAEPPASGEVAVEGESNDPGYGEGTHHVIIFARGEYKVSLYGRPVETAKGQGYARVIDANILASTGPGCMVEGNVVDSIGAAVADIHVRLHAGGEQRDTSTDAAGHYRFPPIAAGGAFDPARDELNVELIAEGMDQLGSAPRFQIYSKQLLGGLTSDPFKIAQGVSCSRDFDLRSLPASYSAKDPDLALWPDVIESYQQTWTSCRPADAL